MTSDLLNALTRFRWCVYCIYDITSGTTHYVLCGHGRDDELISEADALAVYGNDWIAERMLAGVRRCQNPAIVDTLGRSFRVLAADQAPILLDGEPYVPESAA